MYGINGRRAATGEVLAASADTWNEADEKAKEARNRGWDDVTVVPAVANTCHSPLGDSPATPVCALNRGHSGEWHEVTSGVLQWRDDNLDWLRHCIAEQRKRDT